MTYVDHAFGSNKSDQFPTSFKLLINFQAFTIVWLGFGLGFIFMINLLMMDHIRGMSKQLLRSSRKSIKKLRRFAKRSAEGGPDRFKEVLQKKTSLKRVHSAPSCITPSASKTGLNNQVCFMEEGEIFL